MRQYFCVIRADDLTSDPGLNLTTYGFWIEHANDTVSPALTCPLSFTLTLFESIIRCLALQYGIPTFKQPTHSGSSTREYVILNRNLSSINFQILSDHYELALDPGCTVFGIAKP